MRVFLDTDLSASAIATRGICADVLQVTLAEHELVVGEKVRTELHRVLMRSRRRVGHRAGMLWTTQVLPRQLQTLVRTLSA